VNGMSGLSFFVMIDWLPSTKNCVRGCGRSSGGQSGSGVRMSGSKRLGGLRCAPRPWIGALGSEGDVFI